MKNVIRHLFPSNDGVLLTRAFAPLASLLRRVTAGRLDLLTPERIVGEFYSTIDVALDRIPGHAIMSGLAALLRNDQFWQGETVRAGRTRKVQAFADYFADLNRQHPYASTILIMGSRFVGRGVLADYLRATGMLQRASSTRRERRAEWLRQASVPIVESLYYEFASIVYSAECLRLGETLRCRRGGAQLAHLARRTPQTLAGLFAGDEGRPRNAAVHYDRWRYEHATDHVHLTDENWSEVFSTSALLAQLRELLEEAMLPFQLILRLHGQESKHWLRAVLAPDEVPEAASMVADYARTTQELQRLGWRAAGSVVVPSRGTAGPLH